MGLAPSTDFFIFYFLFNSTKPKECVLNLYFMPQNEKLPPRLVKFKPTQNHLPCVHLNSSNDSKLRFHINLDSSRRYRVYMKHLESKGPPLSLSLSPLSLSSSTSLTPPPPYKNPTKLLTPKIIH